MIKPKFPIKVIFPIIKNIIREINLSGDWADRDAIVKAIFDDFTIRNSIITNPKVIEYFSQTDNSKIDLYKKLEESVDWFSAHFKSGTGFMQEYLSEFIRKEIPITSRFGKKRKIKAYKVV